ncbi:hypothetical protein [Aurantibacter aestuarii]|uniref:Glycosyltransferase RgtA/B/C/D-like domain-containing protein n=1 Tax=Aurantibacter aestuarii TaxID=1266046 RepID=A0A2T1N5I1_9FLAO|nr:hypothetical protein [Aurantibacter aestuarii]PSG86541.1 hypothetical protein C7H52_12720 [Aurantibacter aestuarii]
MQILKKKYLLILFSISWLIKIIHSNKNFSPLNVTDPDNYFISFNFFLKNSYYEIMANGSSYLFNLVNYLFYTLTKNISVSFFLTNLISEILLIFFGLKILQLVNQKHHSKYAATIGLIYLFNTLDLNDYQHSNNDVFQAVFIALAVLFLLKQCYYKGFKKAYYIYSAILISLCTLIRPTSLVVIVMAISAVFFIEYFKKSNVIQGSKHFMFFLIPLILLVSLFHFPSIKEHNRLGFYNKSNSSNNWVQRNYLGTKRMQNGELPIHKNSIFRDTKFSDVNVYLAEHGSESLPKTQGEFLKRDPVLSGLIFGYNLLFTFTKSFRYYGLLILLPLLYLLLKPYLNPQKWLVYLWIIIIGTICFIPFTLMEYRWYTGYDIIFALAIFTSVIYFEKTKYSNFLRYTVNTSLILVTIFNLLLAFVISSNY